MGYAIFTARKLMLTNRINQINFRIIQLSQQKQTLADQAARAEIAQGNMRNLFSSIGNMMTMSLQTLQQNRTNSLLAADPSLKTDGNALYNQLAPYIAAQQNVSSVFAAIQQSLQLQSQTQMKQINDAETNIDLQLKALYTQVAAMEKEREEIEKKEEKEIQNSGPKFA